MEPSQEPKKKSEVEQVGGILGILLVVILLAAGGIYFLVMQHARNAANEQELQQPANS